MDEPVECTVGEFVHRGVAAVGGDHGLETAPQIFARVDLGRTERQPGGIDPSNERNYQGGGSELWSITALRCGHC